ncbi:MAG: hypothetical protein WDZ35_15680 [Crocinitomicaceae bacterium]
MRILLLFILVFASRQLSAQLAEPLIGSEYNTSKKENFSGFLGENSLAVFTADYLYYSRRKQELIIRKFHKGDLQLINSENIYTEIKDGYTNEPEEIFYQNDTLFLFSKLYSERDKTRLLALQTFDNNCNQIESSIVDTLKGDEISYIEVSSSKDGFLLASHLKYTQLIEQEIDLIRINRKGTVAWRKTIRSPMALQSLRIEQIRFNTDDSPLFILCNYAFDLSSGSANERLINNNYSIWSYDHKQEFLKEFDLRLKSKWVNGIQMKLTPSSELVVAGYFNESKNPAINGVFSLKVSKKLKLLSTSWHKFESDLMDKFFQNRNINKDVELSDYQLKNLALLKDGSFFLLGEQYYKYVERSYDPRTNITTTTEHYNYNSIIASYFDRRGNHKWSERISKSQGSTNDFGYFSSFCLLNSGQDIYLIFNDSRKNNESPPGDYYSYNSVFNNRRSQISYVHLTPSGIKSRGGLMDESYSHVLRAKLSGQISENSIYLITEANRSAKIVRVTAKESD